MLANLLTVLKCCMCETRMSPAERERDEWPNNVEDLEVGSQTANGCCSKISPTVLAVKHPIIMALLNATIYYADFGTDVGLAIKANEGCPAMDNPPTALPYAIIFLIILHPVMMSAADLLAQGGMGLFGVLLNFTNTRMLHAVYKAVAGDGRDAVAAAKTANDVKLFEAVLESMPQLHLQCIYLLFYPDCVGDKNNGYLLLYLSLALSTVSIVFALATKFERMFDKSGNALFTLAVWLYFMSDVISRGLAVAMMFGAFGGAGVAVVAGVWVILDVGTHCCGAPTSWEDYWFNLYRNDFPSTLISLLTVMPLSTKEHDRTRLFFLSICATFVMALCGTLVGYEAVIERPATTAANASPTTKAVVFAALAVKSIAYVFGLRGGMLERGQGALETAGFAALFSLSGIAGNQNRFSWNSNDWADFARDPANKKAFLANRMTWGAVKSMAVGIQLAGAECTIVDLALQGNEHLSRAGEEIAKALTLNKSIKTINLKGGGQYNDARKNFGPKVGKALAKALTVNTTIESINVAGNDLGDEAGKEFAKALVVNKSIKEIDLTDNKLGPEAGNALAKALAVNKSIETIRLGENLFDAESKKALQKAWGDRDDKKPRPSGRAKIYFFGKPAYGSAW